MEYALYRFFSYLLMENEHVRVRRHRVVDLEICDVTLDELDALEREGSNVGLDFQICQACLILALSFFATLLTVKIDSLKVFTVFVVIVVAGIIISLAFGVRWFQNRRDFAKLIQKIRERQIGPVGQEGKPIDSKQLAELSPVEPPVESKPVGDN